MSCITRPFFRITITVSTIWSTIFILGNPQHVVPIIQLHNFVFPKHGCHSQRFLKFPIPKQFPLSVFVFFDFLVGTRVAMRFPAKITSSCIYVAIPVDWVVLHWYGCGADRQSLPQCTVTLLPNFLGWVDLVTHGALLTCTSSANSIYSTLYGPRPHCWYYHFFNLQSSKLTNLLYMEFCDGCVELCILE